MLCQRVPFSFVGWSRSSNPYNIVKAAPKVAAAAPPKAPPKLALEGNKWVVENYVNDSNIIIDKTELRQTVYIYNCTNSTIQVKGKVNAVTIGMFLKHFSFSETHFLIYRYNRWIQEMWFIGRKRCFNS